MCAVKNIQFPIFATFLYAITTIAAVTVAYFILILILYLYFILILLTSLYSAAEQQKTFVNNIDFSGYIVGM